MIHPLLDPESLHYDNKEEPCIFMLEEEMTVREMIGWCKGNIFKYTCREKGSNERDDVKKGNYERYKKSLEHGVSRINNQRGVYDNCLFDILVIDLYRIIDVKYTKLPT